MAAWSVSDWLTFLAAAGAFATTLGGIVTTIILQLRGNAKTEQAKAISTDTNIKMTATVAQAREIARAVPGATTAPTDIVIQRAPATDATGAARRSDDPPQGA